MMASATYSSSLPERQGLLNGMRILFMSFRRWEPEMVPELDRLGYESPLLIETLGGKIAALSDDRRMTGAGFFKSVHRGVHEVASDPDATGPFRNCNESDLPSCALPVASNITRWFGIALRHKHSLGVATAAFFDPGPVQRSRTLARELVVVVEARVTMACLGNGDQ